MWCVIILLVRGNIGTLFTGVLVACLQQGKLILFRLLQLNKSLPELWNKLEKKLFLETVLSASNRQVFRNILFSTKAQALAKISVHQFKSSEKP